MLTRNVFAWTLENQNTMEPGYPEFRIYRTFRYLELEVVSRPGVDLCQCIAVIFCWISRTTRCVQPFLMVLRRLYCTEKALSTLSVDFRKVLCSCKLSQTTQFVCIGQPSPDELALPFRAFRSRIFSVAYIFFVISVSFRSSTCWQVYPPS